MKFYQTKYTLTQLSLLRDRIERAIYEPIADLEITAWRTKEPVPFNQRQSGEKLTLKQGDRWGELFDCAWFYFTGQVPISGAGKNIVLLIDLSGEALVVDHEGNPVLCLTTVSSVFDRRHGIPGKFTVPVTQRATGGEKIELWADVGNNDLFGNLQNDSAIQEACIAICYSEIRALYYDFEVLYELLSQLPQESARYQRILYALYKAASRLNELNEKEARAARRELAPELAKKNGDYSLQVSAIGHAHLDLAWLWPIRETIRKGARTFSHALKLMEEYPDYLFGASQAQLYQWMKDHYPTLYERVTQKIAEGHWEPLSATWVEPDTNITGGEALIRQFLYGKRFSQTEFGKDIPVLFLPDSFGYSGALPQIMKKCGIDYFLTIKLSWDRFNTYPHHTFLWQGIDGSEVLAHTPPEGNYNSSALPRAIRMTEREFLDKAVSEDCLLIYGIGDGGGGPGEEHLERLKREQNLEGLPPVKQEQISHFFKRLEAGRERYHTWVGELYLGVHQGTITTQGRNKFYNRKLELALRELEFTSVIASCVTNIPYPKQKLDDIWQEVLLYQFHDILPGSSITRVYNESLERYVTLFDQARGLINNLKAKISKQVNVTGFKQPILITNSLSWDRKEWLKIDDWYWVEVPAMGYTVIEGKDARKDFPNIIAEANMLENDYLRVQFDGDGHIISIFDKENQREVIEKNAKANRLILYHDDGDAWDFSVDYEYRQAGEFMLKWSEFRVEGPRAIHKQVRGFGRSKLVQKIILTAGSRRLDFETQVGWNESHKMLRVAFPVNIWATESVSEIQFGHIKRPNHQNTSWEQAKFEICAHKWIDISQPDYGVALLKDSKYGHKVVGNILDLNLLRSPKYPDPEADHAVHEFTYALYPHRGDHIAGGVIQAGYELNVPLEFTIFKNQKGDLPSTFSFFSLDVENIIVESVKRAEDNDDIILRLYEAYGMNGKVEIKCGFKINSAYVTNMLEEDISEIETNANSFSLEFKPFEIQTIRLKIDRLPEEMLFC